MSWGAQSQVVERFAARVATRDPYVARELQELLAARVLASASGLLEGTAECVPGDAAISAGAGIGAYRRWHRQAAGLLYREATQLRRRITARKRRNARGECAARTCIRRAATAGGRQAHDVNRRSMHSAPSSTSCLRLVTQPCLRCTKRMHARIALAALSSVALTSSGDYDLGDKAKARDAERRERDAPITDIAGPAIDRHANGVAEQRRRKSCGEEAPERWTE
jgi:hypothetical protein